MALKQLRDRVLSAHSIVYSRHEELQMLIHLLILGTRSREGRFGENEIVVRSSSCCSWWLLIRVVHCVASLMASRQSNHQDICNRIPIPLPLFPLWSMDKTGGSRPECRAFQYIIRGRECKSETVPINRPGDKNPPPPGVFDQVD